ncbi:MAG: 3'-5' exonuclease, partial [Pyrinomonadaceae bacterium]
MLSLTRADTDGRVQYRDIALLFRAMTDVPAYEATLRRANIPFQTVQGKGFYEREEIGDLIQLLRFLDNKTDEIALAAVLRSPLGGVSDNALLALRCAPWLNQVQTDEWTRYFNQPRKLFHALRRHQEIAFISDHDHDQLERTGELLRTLIERRNHSPLAELLRFAVEESEYLTVIAANFDGAQRLANVQKLFTLAERFERSGAYLIRDLVRYVEEFEAIGSREGEGQIDESANAVRLMTIHQEKGLEFPVVIIPNLHHRVLKPQEHWFALDRYYGLTVKIPDGRGKQVAGLTLEKFRERAKRREHFESVRLLYVAATRAQNRLVLSGVTDDLNKLNGSADNWLKQIWQKLELQISKSGVEDLTENAQLAVTLNLGDEARRDAAPGSESVPLPPVDSGSSLIHDFPLLQPISSGPSSGHLFSVTQLINYRRCARQYYFDRVLHIPSRDEVNVWNDAEALEPPANLTATIKGAVIHRFCETYSQGDNAEARLRQSLTEVVTARQAQLADRLLDINTEEAIKELWPLAQNYLSSRLFQRIEEARKRGTERCGVPGNEAGLWSELSFRLRRPLGILTGAIDKVLITPSDQGGGLDIEVVDFKTNRFRIDSSSPASASLRASSSSTASSSSLGPRASRPQSRRATTSINTPSAQMGFDFSSPAVEDAQPEKPVVSIETQVSVAASDYQLQMQAYALAVRDLLPHVAIKQIRATLHFLQPDIEFHLSDALLSRDVCAQALDDAMLAVISSREPHEFPVRPEVHCRMCNFLDVC